ncbi:hypothetical protein [Nitrosomonas supralitoralis]|uniref:Uncharacterized protein n=1 Tax=Nitrosomonas supralitoralis TaxID=2116706 RepID=A0A2P7NWH3_9PROT|nr:hypothetical protein [Nitrosomonas supralitoralis]PSJ17812.1 hypothetical protein C7H79_06045 [Nitrosomonas supralitoralis]
MHHSEPESGLNFNLIMLIALLAVLLIVPFSINALMHMLSAKRPLNAVIMKLPTDSTAITIPPTVKQYEGFEITLNLETKHLARFLSEIVATASEGTSIQGINGAVSPNMKAEIIGATFEIDRNGPQGPNSDYGSTAKWRWWVTANSSGEQVLKFRLHLLAQNSAQTNAKILDLAEANFSVQANPIEWVKRNGIWVVLLLSVTVAILYGLRRRYLR